MEELNRNGVLPVGVNARLVVDDFLNAGVNSEGVPRSLNRDHRTAHRGALNVATDLDAQKRSRRCV